LNISRTGVHVCKRWTRIAKDSEMWKSMGVGLIEGEGRRGGENKGQLD